MAETDMQQPSVDMTQDPIQPPEGEHPFWQDLNPDFLKGENYGEQGPHPEKDSGCNAYTVKDVNRSLNGFTDDDLRQIPIMPAGARLEQGAVYIDLRSSQPSEFTATGDMVAGENNRFAPKADVPYPLWNRLIGVQNPERLDQAGERS